MSTHKLSSPTATYVVLPCIRDTRELERHETQFQQGDVNKPKNVTTKHQTSQNAPQLQSRNDQMESEYSNNQSSIFNSESGTGGKSVSMITENRNKQCFQRNRMEEVVSNKAANQSRQQEKNKPKGAVSSVLPGVSAQREGSNNDKGNKAGGRGSHPGSVRFDCIDESDSDSWSSNDFEFRRKNRIESLRLPYSASEDKKILNFVLLPGNMDRVGSLSLWRELETQMLEPKRTYQSLKNRFLRNIKPHLLTKYKDLLTKEAMSRVRRKFPELKRTHTNQIDIRPQVNVVLKDPQGKEQGSARSEPIPSISRTESSGSNELGAENVKEIRVQQSSPVTAVASVEKTAPVERTEEVIETEEVMKTQEPKDREEIVEIAKEETAPPKSFATENTSAAVDLFKGGQARGGTAQSFQYSKIIKTLRRKTNLNLNFVILNDQSPSHLSNLPGPVKVDIVVSVSSIVQNGVDGGKVGTLKLVPTPVYSYADSCSNQSQPAVSIKKKKRKKRPKPSRNAKRRIWSRRYILQIENNVSQKNEKNEPPAETVKDDDLNSRILSHTWKNPEPSNPGSTQETDCSIEDDSDYSQIYREVSKTYQVVVDADERDGETPRKKHKIDDSGKSDILLKNMVGMLSSKSKVFTNKRNVSKGISKKL